MHAFLWKKRHVMGLLSLLACSSAEVDSDIIDADDTSDMSSTVVDIITDGDSFLCVPAGAGPFPGVLYNHGGRGQVIGGDLEGTCRALAEAAIPGLRKDASTNQ